METKPSKSIPNPDKTQNNHQTPPENQPKPLYQMATDEEVRQAYLASKQQWEEVYRRLADS